MYKTQHALGARYARAIGVKDQVIFYPLDRNGDFFVPAPCPRLLAIHAACCKIAHMSAAADILKPFFRDPEPMLLDHYIPALWMGCAALGPVDVEGRFSYCGYCVLDIEALDLSKEMLLKLGGGGGRPKHRVR